MSVSGGGYQSGAIEPSCVRLADGRLWMLIRTQTGSLWESFSDDRGETWSPAKPSHLPSSNAPATLVRLTNGDVAVVWNDHVSWSHARQSLVVGLTRDAKTFKGVREIDHTDFSDNPNETPHHVTYAHLTESSNGDILAAYNKGMWARYNRATFVRIQPEWITQKSEVIDFQDGRYGWHTFNPGPTKKAAIERYVDLGGEKLWLRFDQNESYQGATGISRNIPLISNGEVRLVVRVEKREGYILFGNSLVDPSVPDEAAIRLRFSGAKILVGAGRQKVAKKDYGRTEYSYISYLVDKEKPYPATYKTNEDMHIVVRYQANSQKAIISINNGPKVEIKTEKIFGLTFVGLSVSDGGRMCVAAVTAIQN